MLVVWSAQFLLCSQGIGFIGDSSENRVTDLQISYWFPCLNFFDAQSVFVYLELDKFFSPYLLQIPIRVHIFPVSSKLSHTIIRRQTFSDGRIMQAALRPFVTCHIFGITQFRGIRESKMKNKNDLELEVETLEWRNDMSITPQSLRGLSRSVWQESKCAEIQRNRIRKAYSLQSYASGSTVGCHWGLMWSLELCSVTRTTYPRSGVAYAKILNNRQVRPVRRSDMPTCWTTAGLSTIEWFAARAYCNFRISAPSSAPQSRLPNDRRL